MNFLANDEEEAANEILTPNEANFLAEAEEEEAYDLLTPNNFLAEEEGIPFSSFQQRLVVAATSHASHSFPLHMNDTCNHFAADNIVIKLAEEREEAAESSSAPSKSSFQLIQQRLVRPSLATQPALGSLRQSNQCSSEYIISHFVAHDGTLKKAGTPNVVQKLAGEREEEEEEEEELATDEINSSAPLSSFQLIQSRFIRSSSVPTMNLQQTNVSSASHHLAPLSVYQDW